MKLLRIGVFAAALVLAATAQAQVKISDLPAGTALTGTEALPAVQSAATVKTTPAAIDTYVKTAGATLGVAKGGTGQGSLANDALFMGAGTGAMVAKAIPSCSGAGQALTYNTTTDTWACATLAASASGTFTMTATAGLASPPSVSASYSVSGSTAIVCTNTVAATSNATNFILGTIPAAARPATVQPATVTYGTDNSINDVVTAVVTTGGTIVLSYKGGSWTASGSKASGNSCYVYSLN